MNNTNVRFVTRTLRTNYISENLPSTSLHTNRPSPAKPVLHLHTATPFSMKQLARLLQNALAHKSVGEIDGGDVGKGTGAKVGTIVGGRVEGRGVGIGVTGAGVAIGAGVTGVDGAASPLKKPTPTVGLAVQMKLNKFVGSKPRAYDEPTVGVGQMTESITLETGLMRSRRASSSN
jgi:hypothetical protein